MLAGKHIDPPHAVDRIRAEGTAALQRWGGPARFMARFMARVAEFGDRASR